MSLDQAPEPTLQEMKGRLETIEGAWLLASSPGWRKDLNEKFKALAEEITQKYGAEGKKVVDQVVARHKQMQWPR
jgi:hypothetical protein